MKFIHTADWQIGMTFHGLREYSREAMSKARLEVIDAIADYANDAANGIDFVLVCGDMFQTPRISETLVKNTFKKIERINKPVYVLAGNHEWNGTEFMFTTEYFLEKKPPNLHVLDGGTKSLEGEGIVGVEIVAAPLEGKEDTFDLVKLQLDLLQPTNNIRILAGHGAIDKVVYTGERKDLIALAPIEEAITSGKIHYAAFGDRHSTTKVGTSGAVWYSGAPEPTDYDEDPEGQRKILVVEVKPGEKANVEQIEVGKWEFICLGKPKEQYEIRSEQDLADLEARIDGVKRPSQTLVKIYLDSVLDVEADLRRESLFDEWENDTLAGFAKSDSSLGARREVNPLTEKVPTGLSGYALSAYLDLKERAMNDDEESEIALEALKLLTEFAGGNK
jgi:DNA repair exonuclease SbcCD nuclease subunit